MFPTQGSTHRQNPLIPASPALLHPRPLRNRSNVTTACSCLPLLLVIVPRCLSYSYVHVTRPPQVFPWEKVKGRNGVNKNKGTSTHLVLSLAPLDPITVRAQMKAAAGARLAVSSNTPRAAELKGRSTSSASADSRKSTSRATTCGSSNQRANFSRKEEKEDSQTALHNRLRMANHKHVSIN